MATAPGDTRCREVQVHGKWFAVVGITLFLTVGTLRAAAPQKDGIETEDLKLAEEAIVVSMAVASAELHGNQGLEGPGPNPFDLGMAVIGARNSPMSLRALAGLVRFRFDGAYSEDYDSYVMAKGKRIKKVLLSLNPEQLHEQCLQEFANLQKGKSYGKAIQGARENEVCESAGTIRERIQEFVSSFSGPPSHER
jgi:Immunity protein 57